MRAFVAFAIVAGCRFDPQPFIEQPVVDAADDDARVEDADIDGAMVAACLVEPTGAVDLRPTLGGSGGGNRPDLECPAGELPIGAELVASTVEDPGWNNQVVVVTTHIRCGRVERTTDNKMTTAPTGRITREGTNCADPTAASGEQRCPPGAVMIGISGNESGGNFSSYNSVQITCAALATDGSTTPTTTTLDFRATTGDYNTTLESSTCVEGTAIISFAGKAGCTQDQIAAKCRPLACN